MATNLALDPDLLDRVVAVSGEPTKKAAVTLALKEFVARQPMCCPALPCPYLPYGSLVGSPIPKASDRHPQQVRTGLTVSTLARRWRLHSRSPIGPLRALSVHQSRHLLHAQSGLGCLR